MDRIVVFCFCLCLNFNLFSQEKTKIVRVKGNVGVIEIGANHGVKKGQQFELRRSQMNNEVIVGIVEVIAVQSSLSAVKQISSYFNLMIIEGDFIIKKRNEWDVFLEEVAASDQNQLESSSRHIIRFNPNSFASISLGYGNSYGGLGAKFQYNFNSTAIHGGVGYFRASIEEGSEFDFTEPTILFAGGIKFYLTNSKYYFDLQFGTIGIEAMELSTYSSWSGWKTEMTQQTLYGPSVLIGGDWFGKTIGYNIAIGASYNMAEIEWTDDLKIVLAMDFGLIIRL